MAGKIIDEDVFKLAMKNIGQIIADNVYEEIPYQDSEIDDMFDATTQEIDYYSSLISDSLVSENRIFSSRHVTDLLQQFQLDANSYADGLITNLSSIELKYVDSLPSVGNSNTIYILKSTTSDPDTLNLYNEGTWIKIGDFNINLDSYATVNYVDTKLDTKANSSDVLAIDKIQTTTGDETHDNVYSAQLTKSELDKKVNVTDIVDNLTYTDTDKPLSANQGKVLKDELNLKANADEVVKKTDITDTICIDIIEGTTVDQTVIDKYGTDILKYPLGIWRIDGDDIAGNLTGIPVKKSGLIEITSINPNTNKNPWNSSWGYRVYNFETYLGDNYFRKLSSASTAGILYSDTGWKIVCATTVSDVDVTTITPVNSAITGTIEYTVKNGICYVSFKNVNSTTNTNDLSISTTMPKSSINCGFPLIANGSNGNIGFLYIDKNTTKLNGNFWIAGKSGSCSFSYPVAE